MDLFGNDSLQMEPPENQAVDIAAKLFDYMKDGYWRDMDDLAKRFRVDKAVVRKSFDHVKKLRGCHVSFWRRDKSTFVQLVFEDNSILEDLHGL